MVGGLRGETENLAAKELLRLEALLELDEAYDLGRWGTAYCSYSLRGWVFQAELTSFLNQLHAATSQLGVAVSDMQSSVEHQEQRSRQRLQFTMVLASAGRVFRALSTNLMVQNAQDAESGATGVSLELRGEPAGATGLGSTVQDSSNEALVEAESHGVQPLELFPHCWHQTMPGPCPAHLTRPYVSAFLQEVTTFLQQTDFAATPGATDRYPHLSLLLRG
ncbi:Ubiquitin-like domain-containing protein [Durusdinium trenchii]|uniref:Ubiquitin-like domain-containing protein n=1 Tax=Durusdinium trenchii TaxID=1381693 RepID=A0ABP0S4A7_9DINO